MSDQDQVIDGARVGDYHAHRVTGPNASARRAPAQSPPSCNRGRCRGIQEAVYLDTGESEHFAELRFCDASSPEFFQRERFEGAARQIPCPGHAADQFIRDQKGYFHGITLTRPSNRVKQDFPLRYRSGRRVPATRSIFPLSAASA